MQVPGGQCHLLDIAVCREEDRRSGVFVYLPGFQAEYAVLDHIVPADPCFPAISLSFVIRSNPLISMPFNFTGYL